VLSRACDVYLFLLFRASAPIELPISLFPLPSPSSRTAGFPRSGCKRRSLPRSPSLQCWRLKPWRVSTAFILVCHRPGLSPFGPRACGTCLQVSDHLRPGPLCSSDITHLLCYSEPLRLTCCHSPSLRFPTLEKAPLPLAPPTAGQQVIPDFALPLFPELRPPLDRRLGECTYPVLPR
jgi:hypothetical protein